MNMNNNNVGRESKYDDIDDLVNILSEDNNPGNVFFINVKYRKARSRKGFLEFERGFLDLLHATKKIYKISQFNFYFFICLYKNIMM